MFHSGWLKPRSRELLRNQGCGLSVVIHRTPGLEGYEFGHDHFIYRSCAGQARNLKLTSRCLLCFIAIDEPLRWPFLCEMISADCVDCTLYIVLYRLQHPAIIHVHLPFQQHPYQTPSSYTQWPNKPFAHLCRPKHQPFASEVGQRDHIGPKCQLVYQWVADIVSGI